MLILELFLFNYVRFKQFIILSVCTKGNANYLCYNRGAAQIKTKVLQHDLTMSKNHDSKESV